MSTIQIIVVILMGGSLLAFAIAMFIIDIKFDWFDSKKPQEKLEK